jgi:polyisoprenoid-binding protein YceI
MSVVSAQDRLAGAWSFSAVHSAVTFSVPYVVASFRGSFEEIAATLVDGKLSGAAEAASVDRTAYGVSWNADLPSGGRALSDDVELTAELEFIRAA